MSLHLLIASYLKEWLNIDVYDALIRGDLTVLGDIIFGGNVQIDGNLTVLGQTNLNTLGVTGAAVFNGVTKTNNFFLSGTGTAQVIGNYLNPAPPSIDLTADQLLSGVVIGAANLSDNTTVQLPNASSVQALLPSSLQIVGYSVPIYICLSSGSAKNLQFLAGTNFTISGAGILTDGGATYATFLARITQVTPTFTMNLFT